MRNKTKMELINNYVAIHQILFACKYITDTYSNEKQLSDALNITKVALNLKTTYEKSFEKLKIVDTSFLVLKKDLEKGLLVHCSKDYVPADLGNMQIKTTTISTFLNNVMTKRKLSI